jgi:Transglutaminase-like superfamily
VVWWRCATRRIRKLLELPAVDRHLLVRAWFLELAIRVGLWLFPFGQVRRRVAAVHPRPGAALRSDADQRIAWAVTSAARYVPAATCLTQALAAKVLLTVAGREARLRIGVAKDGNRLSAHAWVEGNGRVIVGDHDLSRFTVLPSVEGEDP